MALIAQRERDTSPRAAQAAGKGDKATKGGVDRVYDAVATTLAGYQTIESPTFELGGLGYIDFLRLPPTVVWALLRSTFLARVDCCEVSVDLDQMGKQFEQLLHQACKWTFHR
jgi:hypothetical protein